MSLRQDAGQTLKSAKCSLYKPDMARAIWSGAISFGLVNVPVKLYSATSPKTVRFHQLSSKTGARIRQKRVDSTTGDEVPFEEIVKGYEITPDRYVMIDPEELDALDPKATQDDRHRGVRRPQRDRPDLLRPQLLPRSDRRRCQGVPAAARRDARGRQGRDRPRRAALQAAALCAAGGRRRDRRADADDDAVRRRGARARPDRRAGRDRRSRGDSRASWRWPSS